MFHLEAFADYALLLMRIMVGAIYFNSGLNDIRKPDERAKSIGMSKGFTIFLAAAELAGGLAIAIGFLPQLAAIGLILIMLGAIQKKAFVWKTGFWGANGLGWNYELTLVTTLLVILCTAGGRFVIFN